MPRLSCLLEMTLFLPTEFRGLSLLIAVDRRPLVGPPLECLEPRGMHPPEPDQLLRTGDVDRAPGAARLARRYPVRIADRIDALADAVDPSKAELFVHQLLPRDARLPRTSLVKADEQLCCRCMVSLEPLAQLPGGGKEGWFHLGQNNRRPAIAPASL